jgi:hypothetical protein
MRLLNQSLTFRSSIAIAALATVFYTAAAPPSFAQKSKKSDVSTYNVREKCVAKAQAEIPDSYSNEQTAVMTERTRIYAGCMRAAGLRP